MKTTERKGPKAGSIVLMPQNTDWKDDIFDHAARVFMVLIFAAIFLGIGRYGFPSQPPDSMTSKVWIEFESLQAGLDAAGKLGGSARGYVVCLGYREPERLSSYWVPFGVAVHGGKRDCEPKKGPALARMYLQGDNEVSNLSFESPQYFEGPVLAVNGKSTTTITWGSAK